MDEAMALMKSTPWYVGVGAGMWMLVYAISHVRRLFSRDAAERAGDGAHVGAIAMLQKLLEDERKECASERTLRIAAEKRSEEDRQSRIELKEQMMIMAANMANLERTVAAQEVTIRQCNDKIDHLEGLLYGSSTKGA
ncbi:hypothetical protein IMZ29_00690 [Achromobacter sp. GG226]|uniref:hypothetical protein n=1 Tax=Verticiella alkaliphila TaxID=2779529 RepID=UPI001C0B9F2A|nr:hypothetical protein [Verticiella sp. GG226]MBU4609119.1 hypothetical protein [Verticiella sp. GG226]